MDSLIGYGSDDEIENERYDGQQSAVDHSGAPGSSRRREDDTNYDDVNMDMSEDSQAESEPELPQAEPGPDRHDRRDQRRTSSESRERSDRRDRDRRDKREPRRDERHRSERREASDRSRHDSGARRGLLGDRPDDKSADKVPALMDLKPFGGEPPPCFERRKSQDARDAVSPRFSERDRRDKDRERTRERDSRDNRHSRRSEERRHKHSERRERSRSRPGYVPPSSQSSSSSSERRPTPPSEYRPSYKVNKKLEVMEKMGLQIKTPSGSMATAQQLRAAASEPTPMTSGGRLPSYYNPTAVNSNKILDQVNKRKLLWANKAKNEQEEAAKWSGTRFAQDNDGKQVSKFMRLMGIKDPAAVKPEPNKTVDPIKKQEELFQAMQAQYEVARATTHTMRGVGLGFQRGQF